MEQVGEGGRRGEWQGEGGGDLLSIGECTTL